MTIRAKYASTCACCGGKIYVGDEIEWERGKPARHSRCSAKSSKASKRSAPKSAPKTERQPRFPASAPEPGAIDVAGRRNGRHDVRYSVGQAVHLPKLSAQGGGPDGKWFVVLACRMVPPHEDAGRYDWEEHAWVRPATDEEAAPAAARHAAREERAALERAIKELPCERVSVPMPDGAVVLVAKKLDSMVASGERIALVEDSLIHERVGDPDMCDSWYHYRVRIAREVIPDELFGRIQAFIAAGGAA